MMIVCHTRDEDNGWHEMHRHEHDSTEWTELEPFIHRFEGVDERDSN